MTQEERDKINLAIGFLTAVANANNNVFAGGADMIREQLEEIVKNKEKE